MAILISGMGGVEKVKINGEKVKEKMELYTPKNNPTLIPLIETEIIEPKGTRYRIWENMDLYVDDLEDNTITLKKDFKKLFITDLPTYSIPETSENDTSYGSNSYFYSKLCTTANNDIYIALVRTYKYNDEINSYYINYYSVFQLKISDKYELTWTPKFIEINTGNGNLKSLYNNIVITDNGLYSVENSDDTINVSIKYIDFNLLSFETLITDIWTQSDREVNFIDLMENNGGNDIYFNYGNININKNYYLQYFLRRNSEGIHEIILREEGIYNLIIPHRHLDSYQYFSYKGNQYAYCIIHEYGSDSANESAIQFFELNSTTSEYTNIKQYIFEDSDSSDQNIIVCGATNWLPEYLVMRTRSAWSKYNYTPEIYIFNDDDTTFQYTQLDNCPNLSYLEEMFGEDYYGSYTSGIKYNSDKTQRIYYLYINGGMSFILIHNLSDKPIIYSTIESLGFYQSE